MTQALIVDFGGVLTTPVLDSYMAFCDAEGMDVRDFRKVIRDAYRNASDDDPIVQFELGMLDQETFERRLASVLSAGLGREIAHPGIGRRIMGNTVPEDRMIGVVRTARDAGLRTALLSNSWGTGSYPPAVLALFDEVVISAHVGLRKPDARIFALTLERLDRDASECVFVDDARPNCEAAEAAGMRAILHRSPDETIPWLSEQLGIVFEG